jgi:hypothetical protein
MDGIFFQRLVARHDSQAQDHRLFYEPAIAATTATATTANDIKSFALCSPGLVKVVRAVVVDTVYGAEEES